MLGLGPHSIGMDEFGSRVARLLPATLNQTVDLMRPIQTPPVDSRKDSGHMLFPALIAILFFATSFSSFSEDWPTHLHDYSRGGRTSESIPSSLVNIWTFVSPSAPDAAWQAPIPGVVEGNEEVHRVDYDNAFQVTVGGNHVYFGSSADDQVYCLNLKTGKIRWTFFTGGPVRLAPTIADGRLYFGSDDGRLYCLDALSGKAIWSAYLGPDGRRQLGNGRMISRWPLRTDVIVEDGIAYCGAGVFPHEGVMMAAFNAETGAKIWINDGLGAENSNRNRFSPQGYLLASDELLYSPSGRDLPAAFYRKDGRMKFQANSSWRASGIIGGTYGVLVDGQLLCGANQNVAFDAETGRTGFGWFTGRRTVIDGEISYMVGDETIEAIYRNKYAEATRKLLEMKQRHDGREKDDPQYLYAVRRAELREEEKKKVRNEVRIEALKKEVPELKALLARLTKEEATFEKESKGKATIWKTSIEANASLVGTPDMLFAGGGGFVVGLDAKTGKEVWRGKVDGKAAGLAVANGSLLVSSDTGRIYCFQAGDVKAPAVVRADDPGALHFPSGDMSELIQNEVAAILEQANPGRGFCLVLGLRTGEMAYELAKQSELKIIAIESDASIVAKVRKILAKTGLYGSRISVAHGDPNQLPFSNYFANLVVSESAFFDGRIPGNPKDVARTVRPLGGTVMLGLFDKKSKGEKKFEPKVATFLNSLELGPVEGGRVTRGGLAGAGAWTHQYANSGNTSSSQESRLKAPLGVLWFGDPGPTDMINRHTQGSPPVALDGRMFIVGRSVVLAYDAYNGTKLWEQSYTGGPRLRTRTFPGAIVASEKGVFLATQTECQQFDPATGKILHVYQLPEALKNRRSKWGYLGLNGKVLVGSISDLLSANYSKALFAYDVVSKKLLWTYSGNNIAQLCIALGDDKAFLINSKMTRWQREAELQKDKTELARLKGEEKRIAEARIKAADLQLAVALDLQTGKELWTDALDLTECTGIHRSHGELMMMYKNGKLVFAGASGNGHFWDQFISGEFKQRKVSVVDAGTGQELWSREADYRIRPIMAGDTIIAEPWAYDLYTGKPKMRKHPTTGEETPWRFIRSGHHCGHVAATENIMFFRSASTAYYDLNKDNGVTHFAGMRTGCTINMIPANGLVHIPEASAGCQCLFAIQSTVTLEPVNEDQDRGWGVFNAPGETLPIKHLSVNLGAPGDRRDVDGKLWLAYPRPKGSSKTRELELKLGFDVEGTQLKIERRLSAVGKVRGSKRPWLHTSGYRGNVRFGIPVIGKKDMPGIYTVRLYFAETEKLAKLNRPFNIFVQEEMVASDFRIDQEAGGAFLEVVKEFKGIEVFDYLEMELALSDRSGEVPSINAIEIIRTADLDKPKPPSLYTMPEWPVGKPTVSLNPVADSRVSQKYPDRNEGNNKSIAVDGGGSNMGDVDYGMVFIKFSLADLPGKPIAVKLRLKCGGPGSRDAGAVYTVEGEWDEKKITFAHRPLARRKIGVIGKVGEKEFVELPLAIQLDGLSEISILLRPTSTDGIRYDSREGITPPELIIAYEKE